MKTTDSSPPRSLQRRTLFAGAGTLGAVAAAASLLPADPAPRAPEAQALPKPERGGGYALTERVKQYYKTARV